MFEFVNVMYQLDKVDVGIIQLLSATIRPQSTVRDTSVLSALQVSTTMRYINRRFTYLLTYLLTYLA